MSQLATLGVFFLASVGVTHIARIAAAKLDARAIVRRAKQERALAYRQAKAEFDRAWKIDNFYQAVNANDGRAPDAWLDNAQTTYMARQ